MFVRIRDTLILVAKVGVALSFAVMIVSVLIQVVGRTSGSSPVWTEELARFSMVWGGLLGASCAYRYRLDPTLFPNALKAHGAKGLAFTLARTFGVMCFILPILWFSFFGPNTNPARGYIARLAGRQTETMDLPMVVFGIAIPLAFSLGLVMIVIGGAELFTGNSLMAMAWAARRITLGRLARNWGLVLLGNLAGALGALLLFRLAELPAGAAAETAKGIAAAKLALEPVPAFFRGLLCNVFVCMAVWLSLAARQVGGKVLCVMLPIAAFIGLGLEHSVANFFLLPLGQWLEGAWDLGALARNLGPVILGNVAGGAGLVAAVYWVAYLRRPRV